MREAKRLVVTEQLIREVVHEVAPVVSEATGWPLEIRALGRRVLPRDRGYEEVLLARIKGAGIDLGDAPKRGLLERLLEYVVEGTVLAAYEPSTSELLVVRENVDDSNLDGLRLVVAHELVHRGQHVNHGELFAQVDAAVRAAFEGFLPGGGGIRQAIEHLRSIQQIMSLLESHALYVQEQLRQTHLPGAIIESHFDLPGLLLRVFGKAKLAQYAAAVPEVAAASVRGEVESLYAAAESAGSA